MPMTPEEITARITAALPGAAVDIVDLAGDGDHYQITVTAAEFAGLTRIQQHKRVYAAFGEHAGTTLHAMALTTKALPA